MSEEIVPGGLFTASICLKSKLSIVFVVFWGAEV